jgi:hypothetical protein
MATRFHLALVITRSNRSDPADATASVSYGGWELTVSRTSWATSDEGAIDINNPEIRYFNDYSPAVQAH